MSICLCHDLFPTIDLVPSLSDKHRDVLWSRLSLEKKLSWVLASAQTVCDCNYAK